MWGLIVFGYFGGACAKKLIRYRFSKTAALGWLSAFMALGRFSGQWFAAVLSAGFGLDTPVSVASVHWYLGVLLGVFPCISRVICGRAKAILKTLIKN